MILLFRTILNQGLTIPLMVIRFEHTSHASPMRDWNNLIQKGHLPKTVKHTLLLVLLFILMLQSSTTSDLSEASLGVYLLVMFIVSPINLQVGQLRRVLLHLKPWSLSHLVQLCLDPYYLAYAISIGVNFEGVVCFSGSTH